MASEKVKYLKLVLFVGGIFFVTPFELFEGLYFSNLGILFIFFLLTKRFLAEIFQLRLSFLIAFILLVAVSDVVSIFYFSEVPTYYYQEFSKLSLLVLGIWSFSRIGSKITLDAAGLMIASFVVIYSYAFLLFSENPFTYGGRFQVPAFGSPNTLALILSLSGLFVLGAPICRGAPLRVFSFLLFFLILILIVILQSRGGLFSLFFGLLVLFYRKAFLFLVLGALLFGLFLIFDDSFFDRFFNVGDGYSAGRLEIWAYLLVDLYSQPSGWIFGFGSGSVDFDMFNKTYNSAHSGLLTLVYYYGFPVLLLFLLFSKKYLNIIFKAPRKDRPVKLALMAAFSISFVVDNLFLASQGIIYFSFFLGYAVSFKKGEKVEIFASR